jgi:hypothetical protein
LLNKTSSHGRNPKTTSAKDSDEIRIAPPSSEWVERAPRSTGMWGVSLEKMRGEEISNMRLFKLSCIGYLVCGLLLLPGLSWATVKKAAVPAVMLNGSSSPSQGTAGSTTLYLTGSGFPAGTITPADVTVTIAATCGGASLATATATSAKHIVGTSDRLGFVIPATLAQGTYWASAADTTSGQAFTSANCSEMKVLPSRVVLSSCVPGSSMGVLNNVPNVVAYVPNGAWSRSTTGIQVIPIEPACSGTCGVTVPTPNAPNSCSTNSKTGKSVCVANNTDVYILSGTSITNTLTSGASTTTGFSGGSCFNCGVAVDASNNVAVIQMGLSGSPSRSGLQQLDLSTLTFSTPFPTVHEVAEDIQIDPNLKLILSPNEGNTYDLVNTSSSPWVEYGNFQPVGGEFDSAGEDCTTGIALSTQEFTFRLFISDLTQATFTPGSPGTWTAPSQSVNFPEFGAMGAGTSGIAVAPGSHLAIVEGEFGSNQIGVVTLPSSSGSGTPSFGDYVSAHMPPTPDGSGFGIGFDPHTVTAYVSGNNSHVYGLTADWATGVPTYIGVVDLQGLLSAPRCGTHVPPNCVFGPHEVDPTFDLVGAGIVRYTH